MHRKAPAKRGLISLSSIPQIYRNFNRWTEIISILSKYGLADWLSRLPIEFAKGFIKSRAGETLAHHTHEARIRMALTELGPTFIKLGQLLSTRPDIVGVQLVNELQQLQTDVPADSVEIVRATLEAELGQPIDDLFELFDDTPVASASIGQVHRATLKSGEEVVVKVRRAGVDKMIREDLDILSAMAQMAERVPELAGYRPVTTMGELQRALRRELDFGREERNLQQFSILLTDNSTVRIPKPYSELCTPRVLTMEWLEGVKLVDQRRIVDAGFDLEHVAARGAELYMRMIFDFGIYHADPHPGNLLLLPGNVIGLLDFGNVGRMDDRLREDIGELLVAIVGHDADYLTQVVTRFGAAPHDLDVTALRTELADFVADYGSQPLDQFDLGGALNQLTEMIRRFDIVLPPQVALLMKTLVTLDGTARLLSPQFNLVEIMAPFRQKILWRRLSPARRLKKMHRLYSELEYLAEILPRRVMEIIDQIRTGRLDVHLEHRGLAPSVNRMVMGMLVSAMFLGSSLLLSHQVPPLLFHEETVLGLHDVSVLGLTGCVVSLIFGLRLLRAISKSGHLDSRD